MAKLRVLHVRVGCEPEAVEIEHELSEMQRLVGGPIDCVQLAAHVDLWCNDEGLLMELPLNKLLLVDSHVLPVVGDFYIAGHDGQGNTVSLSEELMAALALQLRL